MNNKLVYSLVVVALLIMISLSVSYAFFVAEIQNGESLTTINVDSASYTLRLEGGGNISGSNFVPDNNNPWITKNFSVIGTSNRPGPFAYKLKIVVDTNGFTTTPMKYTLRGISGTGRIADVSSQTPITPDATGRQYLSGGSTGSFTNPGNNPGVTHSYELSLFFPDLGTNQDADMGKTFAAHIEVESQRIISAS